jgi:hypothetical protein
VITAPNDSLLVGVTCSACHSGSYTYGDVELVIDGAPNMLDFEVLLDALAAAVESTVTSPPKLYRLIQTVAALEHRPDRDGEPFDVHPAALDLATAIAGAPDDHALASTRRHLESTLHRAYHAAGDEAARDALVRGAETLPAVDADTHGAGAGAFDHLRTALAGFGNGLAYLKRHVERLEILREAFRGQTPAGPGRADSFDAIWDLLVQHGDVTPMNAPVSIPHLFEFERFHWVHWDGNATAVMGRDYAQAIALGADYIPETLETSVLPHNIIDLERTAHHLTAPAWPAEILGAIDTRKAAAGEALFAEHCARCHTEETLVPLEEIGTDPQRTANFASLQRNGKSYAALLIDLGGEISRASFEAHGVTPEMLAPVERSDHPTWRTTRGYLTRRLDGIWASAPYLHNGSVPTLWDLLQPPSARPSRFAVGRELDPKKLGIDAAHQPGGAWWFDTARTGNGNGGHTYGTELTEDEKWSLIELVKTL